MVFRAGFTCCSSLLGSNLWNVQSAAGHKPCSSAAAVAQLDLLSPVGMGQLQHRGRSCCFHGQKKRHAKSGGEEVTYKECGGSYRFWGFLQSLAVCFPSAIRRVLTAPEKRKVKEKEKRGKSTEVEICLVSWKALGKETFKGLGRISYFQILKNNL